jgi:hypothetical protein
MARSIDGPPDEGGWDCTLAEPIYSAPFARAGTIRASRRHEREPIYLAAIYLGAARRAPTSLGAP